MRMPKEDDFSDCSNVAIVLRHKVIMQLYGINLTVPEECKIFHGAILRGILEV